MITQTDELLTAEGKIYIPKREWAKFKVNLTKEVSKARSTFAYAINGVISRAKATGVGCYEYTNYHKGVAAVFGTVKEYSEIKPTIMCLKPLLINWLFGYTRFISRVKPKDVELGTKNGFAFGPWRVRLSDEYCCVHISFTEADELINPNSSYLSTQLGAWDFESPRHVRMFSECMFDKVVNALEKVKYYGGTGGILRLYDYNGVGFHKTLKIGSGESSKPYFGPNTRKVKSEGNSLV